MYVVIETKEKQTSNDIWMLIENKETKRNCIIQEINETTKINYLDNIIENHSKMIDYVDYLMRDYLSNNNPSEHYNSFKIPKNSGGFRELHEPDEELKTLQKQIYLILKSLKLLSTRWSYAYEKDKCIIDVAKAHQNSNYFCKLDLKHFFNSIDKEILTKQLSNIYQFSIIKRANPEFLERLVDVALLNNELPQGSPLSPILSNLVALELDYKIKNNEKIKNLYYTRYADDLIFSSASYISKQILETTLSNILKEIYGEKIKINYEKTKMLTKNQKLYVVGVKINKDNELTYGHEKKKALKLALYNLFKAKEYGVLIKEEAYEVLGKFSFMAQIEPDYAIYLKRKLCKKFNIQEEKFYSYFLR